MSINRSSSRDDDDGHLQIFEGAVGSEKTLIGATAPTAATFCTGQSIPAAKFRPAGRTEN
jgi:hypothetical protein